MKTIKENSLEDIPKNFTGIIEWLDGSKDWFKEGKRHREDGPARECLSGYKEWIKEGEFHRIDGPAIEYTDGSGEWYLDGLYYHPIILKNYVVLGYDKGKYGIMWYKLLGKNKIFEYPDIPGLVEK
jgi:hypothetical protein